MNFTAMILENTLMIQDDETGAMWQKPHFDMRNMGDMANAIASTLKLPVNRVQFVDYVNKKFGAVYYKWVVFPF